MEVAYWLIRRELLDGVRTKEEVDARRKALNRLDDNLAASEMDDDTGLPSWIANSGIGPADGATPWT